MKLLDAREAARDAGVANPTRPATAALHDEPRVWAVVFRLDPGQQRAPHVSETTVLLTVISGRGLISGGNGEREAKPGVVATFAPGELHGMRAGDQRCSLLATIVREH